MDQTPDPMPWNVVNNYNYGVLESDGKNKIECSNTVFGNTSPEFWKQCFCEVKPRMNPRFCAQEGGKCNQCLGNVVYGAYKYNGKKATFEQMLETQYAVTQIKGRATDIKCDNAMFGDPLPGTRKGCFCDDVGALTDDKIGADLAYFHNQYQVEQDKLLQE